MIIKPSGDRIAVLPVDLSKKTHGALMLPSNSRDFYLTGKVVAVGPGRISEFTNELLKPTHEVGQIVAFPPTAGSKVYAGKVEHYVMPDSHVLCVLDEVEE